MTRSFRLFRIAEDNQVLLPVMVGLDGYTISHTLENVNVLGNDCSQTIRWTTQAARSADP